MKDLEINNRLSGQTCHQVQLVRKLLGSENKFPLYQKVEALPAEYQLKTWDLQTLLEINEYNVQFDCLNGTPEIAIRYGLSRSIKTFSNETTD